MIVVYSDDGASEVGVESIVKRYNAKKVYADDIINTNILNSANMIIFPGGAANPYQEKLDGIGNEKIRKFVENGGIYVGICAGAYYGCNKIEFHGEEYDVFCEYGLKFFDGIAKGSIPELTKDNRYYDETSFAKNFVEIKFDNRLVRKLEIISTNTKGQAHLFPRLSNISNKKNSPIIKEIYYHGGPEFLIKESNKDSIDIIGRYSNDKIAIIGGKYGKGYYLLSGVHFELDKECYKRIILDNLSEDLSIEEIEHENWLFENLI